MQFNNFIIQGLFGREDTIELDLKSKVKIIFGINGSGKTTILKLLNAILTGRLFEIRNVNFKVIELNLVNGKSIRVTKKTILSDKGLKQRKNLILSIDLISKTGKIEESSIMEDDVELNERIPLDMIEHEIPELNRIGRREWTDVTTGSILYLNDIIVMYSDRLPWLQPSTEIDWYRKMIQDYSVKFIQTQRLITMKAETETYRSRRAIRYENTVIDYSERLRSLIKDNLSDSMRISQSLDSSYPRRLLQGPGKRLDDIKLKKLLEQTERLGAKLQQVELLSAKDNIDIAIESISEGNKQAIALYLSDSIKKYEVLEPFADKLLLFLEIVNSKFKPNKTVQIGGKEGIRIGLSDGGEIHPRFLSSGEQHEIVLLFDLIFFSKPKTLVLIDEPEISLHIDWQKNFLSDVEAIGNAADLQFILATHSPAIIGSRVEICKEI